MPRSRNASSKARPSTSPPAMSSTQSDNSSSEGDVSNHEHNHQSGDMCPSKGAFLQEQEVTWMSNHITNCSVCDNEFTSNPLRRRWRHHCRVCGCLVCGPCSRSQCVVTSGKGSTASTVERACDLCARAGPLLNKTVEAMEEVIQRLAPDGQSSDFLDSAIMGEMTAGKPPPSVCELQKVFERMNGALTAMEENRDESEAELEETRRLLQTYIDADANKSAFPSMGRRASLPAGYVLPDRLMTSRLSAHTNSVPIPTGPSSTDNKSCVARGGCQVM